MKVCLSMSRVLGIAWPWTFFFFGHKLETCLQKLQELRKVTFCQS